MIQDAPWLDELGSIARGSTAGRAAETVDKLTTLFLEQAPRLTESHVALFDELILRLARDIEFRARIELAERLATAAVAPPNVLRDLARDDRIEVARPVLEHSSQLADESLIEIASSKSQRHLLAIARRESLAEAITDVLVDRGDPEVVLSVATNRGAKLSERATESLVERARFDPGLAGVLKMRQDLPSGLIAMLVSMALDQARKTLEPEFGERRGLGVVLDRAAMAVAQLAGSASHTDNFTQAFVEVSRAAKDGELTEERIQKWLSTRRVEMAIAAVAYLARIPVQKVARAFHGPDWHPLLILLRGLRYDVRTFELFLACRAGRPLPPTLQATTRRAFLDTPVDEAEAMLKKALPQAKTAI